MPSGWQIYDAFPTREGALGAAKDLRAHGDTVKIRHRTDGRRLAYEIYKYEPPINHRYYR